MNEEKRYNINHQATDKDFGDTEKYVEARNLSEREARKYLRSIKNKLYARGRRARRTKDGYVAEDNEAIHEYWMAPIDE